MTPDELALMRLDHKTLCRKFLRLRKRVHKQDKQLRALTMEVIWLGAAVVDLQAGQYEQPCVDDEEATQED